MGVLMSKAPMKILHVTGVGHSGSTVLAILLAQSPEVFSCGELSQLSTSITGIPTRCSCGQLLSDCSYWKEVVNTWKAISPSLVIPDHAERQGYYQSKCRKSLKKGLGELPRDDVSHFIEEVDALYEAIGVRKNVNCLVDISKSVGRASLLAAYSRHDIRILHLIRDPRGVAWSHRKPRPNKPGMVGGQRKGRSVKNTTKRWVRDNKLAQNLVSRQGEKGMTLRYEDLVCDPIDSIKKVSELIGVDFYKSIDLLIKNNKLEPNHMVAGNIKVQMKPLTKLSLDESWRSNLKIYERLWCLIRAQALMRKVGYL